MIASRTPQGVRGLKLHPPLLSDARRSRTPQGVRGLKPEKLRNQNHREIVALRKECVD